MEISQMICAANQWTGFYMTGISVMKELKVETKSFFQSKSLFTTRNFSILMEVTSYLPTLKADSRLR